MNDNDKQNLMEDAEDEGLKAIMGSKFQDVSREGRIPPQSAKLTAPPKGEPRALPRRKDADVDAADASWVKLNTVSPMARLKACGKWALLFGSISSLLFWWQQAGLLDSKAAIPSFIVCALGAGLTIGWNAR